MNKFDEFLEHKRFPYMESEIVEKSESRRKLEHISFIRLSQTISNNSHMLARDPEEPS